MTVAVEIDEFQVGVVPCRDWAKNGKAGKVPNLPPQCARRSRASAFEYDRSGWPSPARSRNCCATAAEWIDGFVCDEFDGREAGFVCPGTVIKNRIDRAEVALVEPPVGLFGENAGESFAVQIYPLVVCTVSP